MSSKSKQGSQKKVVLTKILETDSFQEEELLKKTPRESPDANKHPIVIQSNQVKNLDLTKAVNFTEEDKNQNSDRRNKRFKGNYGVFSSCNNSSRAIPLTLDSRPSSRESSCRKQMNGRDLQKPEQIDIKSLQANLEKFRSSTGSSLKLSDFLRKDTNFLKFCNISRQSSLKRKTHLPKTKSIEPSNPSFSSDFKIEIPRASTDQVGGPGQLAIASLCRDLRYTFDSQQPSDSPQLNFPSELSSVHAMPTPVVCPRQATAKLTAYQLSAIKATISAGDSFEMNHYVKDVDDQIMRISDKLDTLLRLSKNDEITNIDAKENRGKLEIGKSVKQEDLKCIATKVKKELNIGSRILERVLRESSESMVPEGNSPLRRESRPASKGSRKEYSSQEFQERNICGEKQIAKKIRSNLLRSDNYIRNDITQQVQKQEHIRKGQRTIVAGSNSPSRNDNRFRRYKTTSNDQTRMAKPEKSIEKIRDLHKKESYLKRRPISGQQLNRNIPSPNKKTLALSEEKIRSQHFLETLDPNHIPFFYRKFLQGSSELNNKPRNNIVVTESNTTSLQSKPVNWAQNSKRYYLHSKLN